MQTVMHHIHSDTIFSATSPGQFYNGRKNVYCAINIYT
jgi:hypothetical protein